MTELKEKSSRRLPWSRRRKEVIALGLAAFAVFAVFACYLAFSRRKKADENSWFTCQNLHPPSYRSDIKIDLKRHVASSQLTLSFFQHLNGTPNSSGKDFRYPTFFIPAFDELAEELLYLMRFYQDRSGHPYCSEAYEGSTFPSIGVQKNCFELWFLFTLTNHPWRVYEAGTASIIVPFTLVSLRRYSKVLHRGHHNLAYKYLDKLNDDLSPLYKRNQGRDFLWTCPSFFCGAELHSESKKVFKLLDNAIVLGYVPSYRRLRVSCFSRAVTVPYPAQYLFTAERQVTLPFLERSFQFFFAGRLDRQAEGGEVRGVLEDLQFDVDLLKLDVVIRGIHHGYKYTPADNLFYRDALQNSKFCLVPCGDTPQSQHLFSTIAAGCIPIVVSDQMDYPLDWIIDYDSFVIHWSEKDFREDAKNMIMSLANFSSEEGLRMQRTMKHLSEFLLMGYGYPGNTTDVQAWKQKNGNHKIIDTTQTTSLILYEADHTRRWSMKDNLF